MKLSLEADKYIGGRTLQITSKEANCPQCSIELDPINGILWCPSLQKAWCIKCFNNNIPINHWMGSNREHTDVKVDKITVLDDE